MESLSGLLAGFDVVFSPGNLLIVFTGVTIGMVVGVLPGLGPTATIALLLPVTYALDPATAIMMLAGVYYGSMYGGTITAVLLNIPGEASSVITAIDGHQMARRGRAGPAIGTAAIGSAIGGFVSAILLVFLAPAAANVALGIGPPDLTAIVALGIILAAYLGTKSFVKALIGVGIGLLLATVGQDPITGTPRFSFGNPDLAGGLEFAAIAMGIFGIGEILFNIRDTKLHHQTPTVGRVLPSREDLRRSGGPISRGTIVGYILGLLPGSGGMVPPLASYAIEKRISKNRDEFGEGAIEGVAGPETASNAGAQAAFVPLLTLGLPTTSVLALMFGALMIQGVTPGPALITENPDIFWGVIASMFIGNIFLLGLNIPLIGIFVQLLRIPLSTLGPIAILITLVGVYSLRNNIFDMYVALGFGIFGYFMRKAGIEPGPLVLAFILGSVLETSLRQSLRLSDNGFAIFVTRPVSGIVLLVLVSIIGIGIVRAARSFGARRKGQHTVGRVD